MTKQLPKAFLKRYYFTCAHCGIDLIDQGEIGFNNEHNTKWFAVCKKHSTSWMTDWMPIGWFQDEAKHDDFIIGILDYPGHDCGVALLQFLWKHSVGLQKQD